MKNQRGIAPLLIVIAIAIIAILGSTALHKNKAPGSLKLPFSNPAPTNQGSGLETIYDEGGIKIIYVWPAGTRFISNEEVEIRITNSSKVPLEVTDPLTTISASNKVYNPASEGWESFESETSQEIIDKIIIYKSVPESPIKLAPGKYGRLHYHFLFDDEYAQTRKQEASVDFNLQAGDEIINISRQLERAVTPTDTYESSAEHPVEEYFKDSSPEPDHN